MTMSLRPSPGRWRARVRAAALLLAGLAAGAPAPAQLGLPRVPLPNLPRELPRELPRVPTPQGPTLSLPSVRADVVRELLRDHADQLEADPAGEPVRRREIVLLAPAAATLEAARALGFVVLREQTLPELELAQVVLRPPPALGTAEALARLRAIDPDVDADFNHLYLRSATAAAEGAASAAAPMPAPLPASAPAAAAAAATATATAPRVGLVDSGIDRRHPALRAQPMQTWGCDGRESPSQHGTAVASLLVGQDGAFRGSAAGATLYAADIYCGQPVGGAVEQLVAALAWLARERVAVINLSLVGPANRVLERAVAALHTRGHLLVAAVGNDGPAAPPMYPAAYPGVVGVTGVSPLRRVLPEAGRGPQVMLAAPGSELAVARPGGGYTVARGTSFAAPLVAGLLAEGLPAPDRAAAAAVLARVAQDAQDLGAAGPDPVYGQGLVAERVRVAPERVRASAR